jgi:hypothetical protein
MPVATTIGLPPVSIKFMLGLSLFAAVLPSATSRSRWLLFVVTCLLVIARAATDHSGLVLALVGVAGLLSAAAALRFTLTSKVTDGEALCAALSTYLLAGLFFGEIYWSLENIHPGSIVGPDPASELTMTYYSFVTLATLGYGDFLPRTDIARGVAVFEVICGQLFLAVLVARLISGFGQRRRDI